MAKKPEKTKEIHFSIIVGEETESLVLKRTESGKIDFFGTKEADLEHNEHRIEFLNKLVRLLLKRIRGLEKAKDSSCGGSLSV